MSERWSPGETVVLQEVWRGRVWAARPLTVVEDHGEHLALWMPAGTRWKAPTTPPSRERSANRGERVADMLDREDWVHVDVNWDLSSLWLLEAGAWHALWVSWLPSGEFFGWYVNLQQPFERTPRGLHYMDLALDVVVEPDRRWRWKDEDELALLRERGLIDDETAELVRAEALDVIRRLEANEAPFSEPWSEWRPDPAWTMPELPSDWERL